MLSEFFRHLSLCLQAWQTVIAVLKFGRHFPCVAHQVYEVGKDCQPEKVLNRIWGNFDEAIKGGDSQAEKIRASIRLIACGGDGTIAWLLSSVR